MWHITLGTSHGNLVLPVKVWLAPGMVTLTGGSLSYYPGQVQGVDEAYHALALALATTVRHTTLQQEDGCGWVAQ